MRIALLQTGKTTEKHISEGVEIYSARIRKYCGFEIITLPDLKNTRNIPVKEQKDREGKKILQSIGKNDFVVLLDEKGKELSTKEFAEWVEKRSMVSGKRMVFVIGGPWGFSDEVNEIADFRLSLSKMTFPHQLVRLLFAEQVYRAFSIIKGEPYHHE
jgi:23S rRNA (pseudouridine1915-N3)-methyltransferase